MILFNIYTNLSKNSFKDNIKKVGYRWMIIVILLYPFSLIIQKNGGKNISMNPSKKKIAFYISSLDSGGAQRAVSNLSLSLDQSRYDIFIIINENKIKYAYRGQIISLDMPPTRTKSLKGIRFFQKILKLRKLKKTKKFDVVASFLPSQNIINILTKQSENNIISVRNHMTERFKINKSSIIKFLIKIYYRKAEKIVSVSQGIKEDLVENFSIQENNVTVINNIINNDITFSPIEINIKNLLDELSRKKILVNIGSLGNQKGQWHLLRVFKKLSFRYDNIHLIIIGDGALKSQYENYIFDNKLDQKVSIIEYTHNPYYVLSKAYLYIHTSIYEGFPNAIIEAANQGLPIITSYFISGIEDLVNSEDPFSSEEILLSKKLNKTFSLTDEPLSQSETKIYENIEMLIDNEKLRNEFSMKSLNIAKRFDYEKILPLWEKLF